MADPTGFLRVPKVEAPKRPVDERVGDWHEVYERQSPQARAAEVSQQARRCMDCGIPFCHSGTAGCPLGNLIPEWNDLVRRGRWDAASERLHATNNFPEFTGRLCPAPCESACVLSIGEEKTGGSVTIKRIENTIADQAWHLGIVAPQPAAIATGKRVAVVGSGPAGLAAAQQLTRAGHEVTVYERDDRIGGLLRYGIPEYKMEKATLNRRLAQMRAEGTRFVTDCEAGVDLPVEELRERHDAVVLAVGALRARDYHVEGRDLDGVHLAMDHLVPGNKECEGDGPSPVTAKGRHVVIIGGGDTGADCLGTAHRQGALSVTQLDYNPEPPETSRRVAIALADVAAGAAHLACPRGGRSPPLSGRGPAVLRRRARTPAGHRNRRSQSRSRRRRASRHHAGRGQPRVALRSRVAGHRLRGRRMHAAARRTWA